MITLLLCTNPVSYTHLDVYKRQLYKMIIYNYGITIRYYITNSEGKFIRESRQLFVRSFMFSWYWTISTSQHLIQRLLLSELCLAISFPTWKVKNWKFSAMNIFFFVKYSSLLNCCPWRELVFYLKSSKFYVISVVFLYLG